MNFKLNKSGILAYTHALTKRADFVREELAKDIENNLQLYSPRRTGKLAASYKEVKVDQNTISIYNDCRLLQICE